MNRMWEIRGEYDSSRHYNIRSAEDKAYECGFEDGYKKAMEELKEGSEYSEYKSARRY